MTPPLDGPPGPLAMSLFGARNLAASAWSGDLLLAAAFETSLLIAFALAATVALRKRSAAARHWLLAAAIGCAAAAPLLEPIAPAWPARLLPFSWSLSASPLDLTPTLVEAIESDANAQTRSLQRAADARSRARTHDNAAPDNGLFSRLAAIPATSVFRVLRAIYLGGLAVNLCVLFAGLVRLASLTSHARRVREGPLLAIAQEVWPEAPSRGPQRGLPRWGGSRGPQRGLPSARFQHAGGGEYALRRCLTLLLSDHSSQVMTWGQVHPKVLLPASADTWPADRVRIVLRHELAHVARGDWITQIVAELLRCMHWFNPLLWIACRQLRVESEQACDDIVLRAGVDAPAYATHLLDLARTASADSRASVPGLAMAGRSGFERRIHAMLNTGLDRRPLTRSTRLTIAIALCAITLPVAGLGAGLGAARQTDANSFSGWIVDPSDVGVANAVITLTDVQTNATREATSDARGHFAFAGLDAGDYLAEVRAMGFATQRMENLRILPGKPIQRNFKLRIGVVRETILISDASAQGDSAKTRRIESPPMVPAEDNPSRTLGQSLQAPVKLLNVNPIYPERLKNAGVGGSVTLEGQIATDGSLANLEIIPPANPDLAQAALEAVRQWRYAPTRLHGVPANTNITIMIDFVLAR
jgi:TonB family protein